MTRTFYYHSGTSFPSRPLRCIFIGATANPKGWKTKGFYGDTTQKITGLGYMTRCYNQWIETFLLENPNVPNTRSVTMAISPLLTNLCYSLKKKAELEYIVQQQSLQVLADTGVLLHLDVEDAEIMLPNYSFVSRTFKGIPSILLNRKSLGSCFDSPWIRGIDAMACTLVFIPKLSCPSNLPLLEEWVTAVMDDKIDVGEVNLDFVNHCLLGCNL